MVRMLWSGQRAAMLRGLLLSVTVLIAGVALLGLSGWFITAAGAAGILGIGATFDFFRPSAGVRFLALGRTAARYGERLLTHDATLKSLAEIRVQLLQAVTGFPYLRAASLRSSQMLNRITSDVDTLDGLTLRLLLPILAAVFTWIIALLALGWLTDWRIALWTVLSYAAGTLIIFRFSARRTIKPARRAEAAFQAFRLRTVDLLRARIELVMYSHLKTQQTFAIAADVRARQALRSVDHAERLAGFAFSAVVTLAATGTFVWGAHLSVSGAISPAQAALGFFAALALGETIMPLRRGISELGRVFDAARRIDQLLQPEPQCEKSPPVRSINKPDSGQGVLQFNCVSYRHPGGQGRLISDFSLDLQPGETVALAGRSGSGKSTLLLLAAGLISPDAGTIALHHRDLTQLAEHELRQQLSLLPQRSLLLGGTVRDALALARPDISEAEAWQVLEAVAMDRVIDGRGGLETRLHEGGAGLSGGERCRLALARLLLRRTGILLLDEPTEGLDQDTARKVLKGIRDYHPDASILVAAHRMAELDWVDRIIRIR